MMGYLQTTKNYNHPSCASKAEKRDWNREVDSVGSWAYEYYCFLSKIRGRRKEFLTRGETKKAHHHHHQKQQHQQQQQHL
jgi:hypothetical protein